MKSIKWKSKKAINHNKSHPFYGVAFVMPLTV